MSWANNSLRLFSSIIRPSSRFSLACAFNPRLRSTYTYSYVKLKPKITNIRLQTSSSSSSTPPLPSQQKPSLFQRFKAMYKDYWYVLVPVHVVTSLGWIGGFYYAVSSGFDLAYYMRKVGFSDAVIDKVSRSGAGNLAVAYALYKIFTPARYAVTLGGTTLAINQLKKLGYIRPAKDIYSSNKERIQKFHQRAMDRRRAHKEKSSISSFKSKDSPKTKPPQL